MSVPENSTEVSYFFTVMDTGTSEEVFSDTRKYNLVHMSNYSIWSLQRVSDEVEAMMNSYREDINTTYPTSGGFELTALRRFTQINTNVAGDAWPV